MATKKKIPQKTKNVEIPEKEAVTFQGLFNPPDVKPIPIEEEAPSVPTLVESNEVTTMDKEIAKMQSKMLKLVNDSLDVLDCAINGKTWRDGKKVSRTQLYAASPLVARFAPELATLKSGAVHLHLSIPRPTLAQGEGAKPMQMVEAQAKDIPTK